MVFQIIHQSIIIDTIFSSSVQNFHGGKTAGQEHSWQATLDPELSRSVFTTQPTDHSYKHDTYWVGGVLPQLGQYRNTLIGENSEHL